jgi:hypothetical protein
MFRRDSGEVVSLVFSNSVRMASRQDPACSKNFVMSFRSRSIVGAFAEEGIGGRMKLNFAKQSLNISIGRDFNSHGGYVDRYSCKSVEIWSKHHC